MKKCTLNKFLTKIPWIPIDNSENIHDKRIGKSKVLKYGTQNIRILYKPRALQNIIQATLVICQLFEIIHILNERLLQVKLCLKCLYFHQMIGKNI